MLKISVVIPTKNAGASFRRTLELLRGQIYDDDIELIVIDSGSSDLTVEIASQFKATVISIPPEEFDHGLTRNRAIERSSGEIIMLMSQDVIPGDQYLISNFVEAFSDAKIAGAYARQIPLENADIITRRNLNNWFTGRDKKEIRWIKEWDAYNNLSPMEHYFFCNFDNVCSAIRRTVWQAIPFRENQFGEDIDWAQQALEAGWKIAYWPASYVFHSHERSFKYEYDRNHLCHKVLHQKFGITTIPSWRQLITSTLLSIRIDWMYVIENENRIGNLIKMLISIPALNFANNYGQYSGAKLARTEKNIIKGC